MEGEQVWDFEAFNYSSQSSSAGDSDYVASDSAHSDEGHSRGSSKRKRIRSEDSDEETVLVTCHWCRQRTVRPHVRCSRCPLKFCPLCLLNRNGEKMREEMQSNVRWVCPKCRGGCGRGCKNCCNCGPCRRRQTLRPTGPLVHTARAAGFSNVHDYLVNLKTGESAEVIARRKDGRRWTKATGAIDESIIIIVPQIRPWGKKGMRSPKKSLMVVLSSKWRGWSSGNIEKESDVVPSDNAETYHQASPSVEREEQDSCAGHGSTGMEHSSLDEGKIEESDGGEVPDLAGYHQCLQSLESQESFPSDEQSGGLPQISSRVEIESWQIHGAIPRRARSVRITSTQRQEREHKEVLDMEENEGRIPPIPESGEQDLGMVNTYTENGQGKRVQMKFTNTTSLVKVIGVMDGSRLEEVPDICSEQQSTASAVCNESEQLPVATDATDDSVRTEERLANLTESAACLPSKDFKGGLDLVVRRQYSKEQLKNMWAHFFNYRPVPPDGCIQKSFGDEEDGLAYLDRYPDLTQRLARMTSSEGQLKLLRGFFFWLQHSWREGSFKPWDTEGTDDDQTGDFKPISTQDYQAIDKLFGIEKGECQDDLD